MQKMACLIAAAVLASAVPVVYGQAGDPTAVQQKLYTQFKLTTITADRSDIVTAGDVVAIHKPGLIMYAVASPMPPSNTYKNGKIGQGWSGFGKDLAITMAAPGGGTATDYPHRPFVPEEKCWVTQIQVQKDGVLFQLYSDPYDNIRYYANLKIPFPNKKVVPSVDVALQIVAEVLTPVPGQDQSAQDQAGQQPAEPPSAPASEQTKSLEDVRAHNAEAMNNNEIIKSLNADLRMCMQDITDGDNAPDAGTKAAKYGEAETLMLRDTKAKPDASALWVQLGRAQAGLMKYAEAESSFMRALELENTAKRPNSQIQSLANAELGKIHARTGIVAGKYLSEKNGAELVFVSDTSVILLVPGTNQNRGQYSVTGDTLSLKFPNDRHPINFKIQGEKLISDKGTVWDRQGGTAAPSAETSAAPVHELPPVASPPLAPMPDITPPPPPPDTPPPTVALGQTMDQVTAGFGQPLKVAKLGVKTIFYYKDMKVTFTNGKISNVE